MGMREQPITNRMKYGRLRRYKCRMCGWIFKDYYLPEDKRVCPRCAVKREGDKQEARETGKFVLGLLAEDKGTNSG